MYSFEHGIRPDEDFSWQSLFDQGAELLDVLIKLGDVAEVCVCSNGNETFRESPNDRIPDVELPHYSNFA